MADVIIVGDGPGGLSAALFLAKAGIEVVVYGQDKTAMHWALLKNYLGISEMLGSDFQKTSREQVVALGATLVDARVESIEQSGATYRVVLEDGTTSEAATVILSEGKGGRLAISLGLAFDDAIGIAVDRNGLTEKPGLYVVGRSARPGRSQAIISAGDGAAAAIDILSRAKGESFCDWDSPPKAE